MSQAQNLTLYTTIHIYLFAFQNSEECYDEVQSLQKLKEKDEMKLTKEVNQLSSLKNRLKMLGNIKRIHYYSQNDIAYANINRSE